MADLPDLDTTAISFVAFWNAIDQGGVDAIDPEDCLSDGAIQEYTLYDNGWEGEYTLPGTGNDATVRVKSDGWFVAYLDRTEVYTQTVGDPSNIPGPWDVLFDWTNPSSTVSDLENNTLERSINALAQELDNWDDILYVDSDVGLYDYWVSDADEYVLFSDHINDQGSTVELGFLYSSKVIHKAVVAGALQLASGSSGRKGWITWLPSGVNVDVVNFNAEDTRWGSYETTADMPDADTEYQTDHVATAYYNGSHSNPNHLIWSSDA